MKLAVFQFTAAAFLGWFGAKALAAPVTAPAGGIIGPGTGECYQLTRNYVACCGKTVAAWQIISSGFDCHSPGFFYGNCESGFCRETFFSEYCMSKCGSF
jgi:hypothetical protein